MLALYLFAILAGIASAIQPGQSAEMAAAVESPLFAGAVSLAVSLAAFALAAAVTGQIAWPGAGVIGKVPWWAWWGGVLSAGLSLAQLTIAKRIGAAPFLGIIVTAGVATSILLDHFGLVGFKVHEASLGRIVGGALMIVGVGLVARY